MSALAQSLALSKSFFLYGSMIPRSYETTLLIMTLYALYLAISAVILYYSVKVTGGKLDFMTGFPRALFTIFIRDLIALPLIFMIVFLPLLGFVIALAVWLGLIKYMFQVSWVNAGLAWIVSLIIPLVVALFIIIPIGMILI